MIVLTHFITREQGVARIGKKSDKKATDVLCQSQLAIHFACNIFFYVDDTYAVT